MSEAETRAVRELAILRAMTEQVTTSLDLDEVLATILRSMDESFGFAHSMILLLDEGGQTLTLVKSRGYADAGVGARVKVGDGVIGVVAKHKKLMRMGGVAAQRRYAAASAAPAADGAAPVALQLPGLPDVQSTVAVPLIAKDALVGVFVVESAKPSVFADQDRDLIETLAHVAAGAVHNARLFRAEQQGRAEVDALAKAGSRFVPFEFLQILGRDRLTDVVRGDHIEKELSILFSDIRSFTTLVEGRTPKQNFAFINEYFAYMEPPIRAQRGFIDSFEGDAIMALFAAPADEDSAGTSADAAVAAAVGDLRALEELNVARTSRGEPALRIGLGVNTGHLMLGTIGGAERIKCGVIGDPVNLAARIEGMTKMYGATLLVSEFTRARLRFPERWQMRVVDCVRVKGKTAPVTVYEVLDGLDDAARARRAAALPTFIEAFAAWQQGRFTDAVVAFDAVLAVDADDAAASLHRGRAAEFVTSPPAEWAGVYDLKSK